MIYLPYSVKLKMGALEIRVSVFINDKTKVSISGEANTKYLPTPRLKTEAYNK